MPTFRCVRPTCAKLSAPAKVPAGARAIKCMTCGDLAIIEDPARPAFRCVACEHIARVSGSDDTIRTCQQCGGQAIRVSPPLGDADAPVIPAGPPNARAAGTLAARRLWETPEFAEDRKRGSRPCDQCQAPITAGTGYLIEPMPPRSSGTAPSMTPEVQKLADGLEGVWDRFSFPTAPCEGCGLPLPNGEPIGMGGFIMSLVGLQNSNPVALVAAVKLCEAYFGEDPFEAPSVAALITVEIWDYTRLRECERCKSRLCRRCVKLPHVPGGCIHCSRTDVGSPRIVCARCFKRHDSASIGWRVLVSLWANRTESLISAGGVDVVQPLLSATRDANPAIAGAARVVLAGLQNADAREEVCRLVLEKDDADATAAAVTGALAPRDAATHPLFFFLTRQWEKHRQVDPDGARLGDAYARSDEALRSRLVRIGRAEKSLIWVNAVLGGSKRSRIDQLADDEWQAVIEILTHRQTWPTMWALAQDAPGRWSAALVRRLGQAGWQPPGVDIPVLQPIVQTASAWPEGDAMDDLGHMELTGHTGAVTGIVTDSEGLLAISVSQDKSVRLWSLADKRLVYTLEGHTKPVRVVATTANGRLLATGGDDSVIRLWFAKGGKLQSIPLYGHSGKVLALAITPDGRTLASAGEDKTIRLWSLPDGELRAKLSDHPMGPIGTLAVAENGRFLASRGCDGYTRIWSLPDGQLLGKLMTGGRWSHHPVIVSRDSCLLATEGPSKSILLWSVPDGGNVIGLDGPTDSWKSLAISTDGGTIAAGGEKHVCLWSLRDMRLVKTLAGHGGHVYTVTMSADDRFLVTAGADKAVRIWSPSEGRLVATLREPGNAIEKLVATRSGWLLGREYQRSEIHLWNLAALDLADAAQKRVKHLTIDDQSRLEALIDTGNPTTIQRSAAAFLLGMSRLIQRR
ncbi:MAG: hypothetical protein HYR84_05290 [Planctomycetes bacterium]|nr:hypothetical protein [Planctomycetota bacterium]